MSRHLNVLHEPLPATWGSCLASGRFTDCDSARCRHNLKWLVRRKKTGRHSYEVVVDRSSSVASCALAVAAAAGPLSSFEIGQLMGMSKQGVDFIVKRALKKLSRNKHLRPIATEFEHQYDRSWPACYSD